MRVRVRMRVGVRVRVGVKCSRNTHLWLPTAWLAFNADGSRCDVERAEALAVIRFATGDPDTLCTLLVIRILQHLASPLAAPVASRIPIRAQRREGVIAWSEALLPTDS